MGLGKGISGKKEHDGGNRASEEHLSQSVEPSGTCKGTVIPKSLGMVLSGVF